MSRLTTVAFRFVEVALVLLMAGMALMVFLNVVLRYGFNSGITWSEEMSRYFFVWLTFIGAVITFYENSHIGVETVVRLLGRRGRIVCMLASNVIILICAVVFFHGTWLQHAINASSRAAVINMSLIWVYGIGYVSGGGIAIIAAIRIARILFGRVTEEEIARFAGEYAGWADADQGKERP